MPNVVAEKVFGETDDNLLQNFFNKTQKEVDDGLNNIMDWYKKQPFFPEQPYDSYAIEKLFGWNKYNVEKTKMKLKSLLIARAKFPDLFTKRDLADENVVSALQTMQFGFVPKLSAKNYRVFVYKYTDADAKLFDPIIILKVLFMIWDVKLHHDNSLGDVYICDYKNFRLPYALQITPSIVKKGAFITQDCYSIMIKQVHILNLPTYGKKMINTLKAVMNKKISERIFVHEKEQDLQMYLPKRCIPKDYGGTADSCTELNEKLCKNLMQTEEWKTWFKESEEKVADIKNMPKNEQNKVGDGLGIVGSLLSKSRQLICGKAEYLIE